MVNEKQIQRAISITEAKKTSIFIGEINGTEHWAHVKPGEDHSTPAFQDRLKKQQAAYNKLKSQTKPNSPRPKNPDKSVK
jgi:hypothetical protein